MKRITAVFLLLIMISGCSFSKAYTDAIEETEEHLMNEQFDQALESIQIALNEKEEDDVALNIESGLLKYKNLENHQEKRDWEKASDIIDSFGTLDSVHPKLKKQVDDIKKEMLEQVNLETNLSDDLAKIESNLSNNLFEEADLLLISLETNEEFDFAQKEVMSMRKNYEQDLAKFKKEQKKAKRSKELNSLLLEHEQKLTEVEKKEDKMKQENKNNQSDKVLQTLNETETAYDELLNIVYQSIIKEFSKKEDKIRKAQREWLVNYEEEIYKVRYNSGDYKSIEFSIKIKKERIKELLDEYF